MRTKKRILVTGSEGFIGKAMTSALKSGGHYVIEYDIKNHRNDYDLEYLSRIIEANTLTHVIHLGAISSPSERDFEKVLHFNYDFTKALIDICYDLDIILQFSSSASVYGNTLNRPFKEDDPVNPQSPYALSKYLCERYAMDKIMNEGAFIQIFRYFNVYSTSGLEESKGNQASPYHKFKRILLEGKKVGLFKHYATPFVRDFISVHLLIRKQIEFLDIEEDGIWNLGTGKTKSFEKVLEEVIYHSFEHQIYDLLDENYLPSYVKDISLYHDIPENIKHQYQSYTCADLTKINETLKRNSYVCIGDW